ncbi:hypothetical protein NIES4101_38950 [Calothrix sp. NIES-4101]|nr:hypothetical protein NIES4101_38950 [Calothrix sp. NIES-4101]
MGNLMADARHAQVQIGQEQIVHEQNDGNRDYGYTQISHNRISVLNLASKPSIRSGWYRNKSAVPI